MADIAQIDIADENIMKLKRIQHVILEEEIESNLYEALARVLEFYRRFVTNNQHKKASPKSLEPLFLRSVAESHRQS